MVNSYKQLEEWPLPRFQVRPADSQIPAKEAQSLEKKGWGCGSVRDQRGFWLQQKQNFKGNRAVELQRPPAGPINTYKCLSKQLFNDGHFLKWVLSLTLKTAIAPMGLGWGRRGVEEVLCCCCCQVF